MARRRRFDWLAGFSLGLGRSSGNRGRRYRNALSRHTLRSEPLEDRRLLSITVDTLVDEADGSIVDGDVSLRDALALATPGETIDFAAGLNGGTIELTLGELLIDTTLTIDGPGADLLTIDAGGNDPTPDRPIGDGSRVMHITANDVAVSGLTLTGGDSGGSGGAVWSTGTNPQLFGLVVTGNHAGGSGGGVSAGNGLTMMDTEVTGNSSGGVGGGISVSNQVGVPISVINSTVSGNVSGYSGGGIVITSNGSAEIVGSTISDNFSGYRGGGILASTGSTGTLTIDETTISGNEATRYGGGIHAQSSGVITITHSTIADNVAQRHAGGVDAIGGSVPQGAVYIESSTISGNVAGGTAGGVRARTTYPLATFELTHSTVTNNVGQSSGGFVGTGRLSHSIFANNRLGDGTPNDVSGSIDNTSSYNLIGAVSSVSGIANGLNGNQIGTVAAPIDAKLGPLADNGGPTLTHALLDGSPAIDAGDPLFVGPPDTDQRGAPFARLSGEAIDIGAYERQVMLVDTLVDESDGDLSRGDVSLREAVEFINAGTTAVDTILFDDALAGGTITLTMGEIPITASMRILGLGADQLTIDASGNDPTPSAHNGDGSRVFNIDDGNDSQNNDVELHGITLTGGDVGDTGGAIRAKENIVVADMSITGNSALVSGGGISVHSTSEGIDSISIIRTVVSRNTSRVGGGASLQGHYGGMAVIDFVDSQFTDNMARIEGGGLYASARDGVVTVSGSAFLRNQALYVGGALFVVNSSDRVDVTDSTFSYNSAVRSVGGLRVVGGSYDQAPGSFLSEGNTITNNSAGDVGGGIEIAYVVDASIVDTMISENDASKGGGLAAVDSETTIMRSTITANSAVVGGGIYAGTSNSAVTITENTISGNRAEDTGGGIQLVAIGGAITVDANTVRGNSAGNRGGGLFAQVDSGDVSITNSTISGNSAVVGGGISSFGTGAATIAHTTVTDNSVSSYGGGLNVDGPFDAIVDHTIIAGNHRDASTRDDIVGSVEARYSLVGDDTGATITDNGGNRIGTSASPIDPMLGPLQDNGGPTLTHAPLIGSPVIDAGDPGFVPPPEFDQRGAPFARVRGPAVDIGAVEFQAIVDTLADESDGDYSAGHFSLREAIELANDPSTTFDTIYFADTLDGGTINLTLGELLVTDSVTIDASNLSNLTIDASGNDPTPTVNDGLGSRIFEVDDGDDTRQIDVQIIGLILTGGDVATFGGAILSRENLSVVDSTVDDNAAGIFGGAIASFHNLAGTTDITRSQITNNSALAGGGVWTSHNLAGTTTITDSHIVGNSAQLDGGGVYSESRTAGETIIVSSSVENNSAGGAGGGINAQAINAGNLSIIDSTLADNSADRGGGVWADTASALGHGNTLVAGSTISGNSARRDGGGVGVAQGMSLSVQTSTIVFNTTDSDNNGDGAGGGLYLAGARSPRLYNTIVAQNLRGNGTADDIHGEVYGKSRHNLIGVDRGLSGITDGLVGNQIGTTLSPVDPLLAPLADNGGPTRTHAPMPGSPVIDAGDPDFTSPPDFDQRGAPFVRVSNGVIDIGAFESQPFVVDTLVDEDDGDISPGDFSLREAVRLSNQMIGPNEIQFNLSLDGGTIDLTMGELLVTDSVNIDARSLASGLTVDATASDPTPDDDRGDGSRIFNLDTGGFFDQPHFNVEIHGLTLTGGDVNGDGGAIRSRVNLILTDSVVTGNAAIGDGGGIYVRGQNDVTVELVGSTISDNFARRRGGGVYADLHVDGVLTVAESTITGNVASSYAGGILSRSERRGVATIRDNMIYDNGGGGVYIEAQTDSAVTVSGNDVARNSGLGGLRVRTNLRGYVTISGNSFTENATTGDGGGIHLTTGVDGTSTVAGNIISNNTSSNHGGGIRVNTYERAVSTITGNVIANNRGDEGGGILVHIQSDGVSNFIQNAITGNFASDRGGGLRTFLDHETTLNLDGNTFAYNYANNRGGAIYAGGANSRIVITNSTFSSNSGAGVDILPQTNAHLEIRHSTFNGNGEQAMRINGDGTMLITNSIVIGDRQFNVPIDPASGYNLINTNAQLGPLADNGGPLLPGGTPLLTQAPLPGSPAIDAGDPNFMPPPFTDQRGYYRVVDGNGDMAARIDIGAVEYNSVAPLPGDGNLDGVVDGLDYIVWAMHFGDDPAQVPPGAPLNGDYNNDGVVDGLDYGVWASNFEPTQPSSTVSALVDARAPSQRDEQLMAADIALEEDYSAAASLNNDPTVTDWQLSRAFDAVLMQVGDKRTTRRL